LEKDGIHPSKIVQLGSNENPYKPPVKLIKKCAKALEIVNRYPDPKYRKLRKKLAEYLNTNESNITFGCGASEILRNLCDLILDALDKVTIPMPSYTMYLLYSMLRDSSISLPIFPYYRIDPSKIDFDFKLLFLCSPNNPTGNVVPLSKIKKIAKKSSGYVVVDEAYAEFSNQSAVKLVEKFDNLIVVRSFSKYFALAGLRIGYAVAPSEVIEGLEKIRLPFGISVVGYEAALCALEMRDWFERIKKKIISERERVTEELRKIKALKVFDSQANFVLIRVKEGIPFKEFEKRGIIVRDLSGLHGLKGNHIRVSIGLKCENNKFIQTMKDCFKD